jgi:hypothetical protein
MMIDHHFCVESDHDKNTFVSVHWGCYLLTVQSARALQRSTTLSRKRTSNSSERQGRLIDDGQAGSTEKEKA